MKKLTLFVMLVMIVGCGSDPSDSIEKNDGCFCMKNSNGVECYYVENLDDIKCEKAGRSNCNIETIGKKDECTSNFTHSKTEDGYYELNVSSEDGLSELYCQLLTNEPNLLTCNEIQSNSN